MKKEITYFINEWSKAVVECLDFLFLLSPDGLDVRVNLQMQRCQKTFIDLYSCNWRAYGWTGAPTFSRNHSWTGEGGPPVSAHTYWGVTAERLHGFLGVQHLWTTQPSEWERTESWGVVNSKWRDDRRSLKPLYRVQGVAQGQLIGQETIFKICMESYGVERWEDNHTVIH